MNDEMERLIELVSDILGDVDKDDVNIVEILELVPLGGLNISLAKSS